MIFAALHVLLAYQGRSFEREEPRYFSNRGFNRGQMPCLSLKRIAIRFNP